MALEELQKGRYRRLRLLGSGSMGEVYLMEDTRINRQVAIKVIRSEANLYSDGDASKEAARLFAREARAIAALEHPHILPLYDFGEEELSAMTLTYMVMPFCPEGSFADWLRQRGAPPLSSHDVVYFVDQAADALQYAHEHQTLHLDVKPSNFLLRSHTKSTGRPSLLLADFGVAKLSATTSGSSRAVRGTPVAMAPEQWSGSPVPATDQYALAVMTYQLLVGRPPFQGGMEQLMYQHFHVHPPLPSSLQPQLARAVDTVLLRALAKEPEARYPSISTFARALGQAVQTLQPQPASIAPPPPGLDLPSTVVTARSETPDPTLLAPAPPSTRRGRTLARALLSKGKAMLLIGLALLVIASGIGLFFLVHANQVAASNANATATTKATIATATADTNATSTAFAQNMSASATANANATATVLSTAIAANPDPYSPAGILALYDPLRDNSMGYGWKELNDNGYGGSCVFTGGAYHVGQSKLYLNYCAAASTDFSNFAFEVQMKIIKGDNGGIIFRSDPTRDWFLYYFDVGQNGSYQLFPCSGNACGSALRNGTSSAIKQGLNQTNLIAVVAQGSTISLYVNHQLIDSVDDSTYSHGQIGVIANPSSSSNPTEVVYSNAKVWTM